METQSCPDAVSHTIYDDEVFQMAQQGRIELKRLITQSYRYEQINEALSDLEHGKLRMGISLWN